MSEKPTIQLPSEQPVTFYSRRPEAKVLKGAPTAPDSKVARAAAEVSEKTDAQKRGATEVARTAERKLKDEITYDNALSISKTTLERNSKEVTRISDLLKKHSGQEFAKLILPVLASPNVDRVRALQEALAKDPSIDSQGLIGRGGRGDGILGRRTLRAIGEFVNAQIGAAEIINKARVQEDVPADATRVPAARQSPRATRTDAEKAVTPVAPVAESSSPVAAKAAAAKITSAATVEE
jgi:hypothetical protein